MIYCSKSKNYFLNIFTVYIGNHDFKPRAIWRFGLELIDGMHMIQWLLPGTPVVYIGDELGMTDTYLRYDQLDDVSKSISISRRTYTISIGLLTSSWIL